ncbi:unnamed protein product, partial [Mesorhabditis spiculigera]
MQDSERKLSLDVTGAEDVPPVAKPEKTPKQRLLHWVCGKLPEAVTVTNFTSDWNDGRALGGLVNSISPESLEDWRDWDSAHALQNTTKAMSAATEDLGVAPLLTPEELSNPNVDEKSVMTYLAQFAKATPPLSKAAQRLLIWINTQLGGGFTIENFSTDWKNGLALAALVNSIDSDLLTDWRSWSATEELENTRKALLAASESLGVASSLRAEDIVNSTLDVNIVVTYLTQFQQVALSMEERNNKLLDWVRSRLPEGFKVNNFSTDWNDGVALAALINSISPDSLKDWRSWSSTNALENIRKAMAAASDLGVTTVLAPEELANPTVNEKSVMTYLAQFAKVTPPLSKDAQELLVWINAQLPGLKIANFSTDWKNGLALAALVNSIDSNLLKDWRSWSATEELENTKKALLAASEDLDVASSLRAEDFVNSTLDMNTVFAYLTQFQQVSPRMKQSKQKLLVWIRSLLPEGIEVNNFSTDWNDGLALAALINSISPDSLKDWRSWSSADALENMRKAMAAASDLGVTTVLTPEALVNPNVDAKSVLTYLSQFEKVAPPPSKTADVTVSGPGLRCAQSGAPATFSVYTKGFAESELSVVIEGPNDVEVHSSTPFSIATDELGIASVTWTPSGSGLYKIYIKLGGEELPDSPYAVDVAGAGGETHHAPTKAEHAAAKPDTISKQGLLHWVCGKLPEGVTVTNFTSDWNDGRALGGLVNSISPESLEDWRDWDSAHALENTTKAMSAATEDLGVAPLLTPEELSNPNVDEKSVMTYLAQFAKVNSIDSDLLTDWRSWSATEELENTRKALLAASERLGVASSLRAEDFVNSTVNVNLLVTYLTQLQKVSYPMKDSTQKLLHWIQGQLPEGIKVNNLSEDWSDGLALAALINSISPDSLKDWRSWSPTDALENIRKAMTAASEIGVTTLLTPEELANGSADPNVLVTYLVQFAKGTSVYVFFTSTSRAVASGPGLSSAGSGAPATFYVYTKGCEDSELSVVIQGPTEAPISIETDEGISSIRWTPSGPGLYKIFIKLGGEELPGSPYAVDVAETRQKTHYTARRAEFAIDISSHSGETGTLTATCTSPSGHVEPLEVETVGEGLLAVTFVPRECGVHWVNIYRDGIPIANNPHEVLVENINADATKVQVNDNYKKQIRVHEENEILVNTSDAGTGSLGVSIQGPSKADLVCREVERGLIAIRYQVEEPGIYMVFLKFGDEPVKGSPISIECTASEGTNASAETLESEQFDDEAPVQGFEVPFNNGDVTKVRAHGPGLHRFTAGKSASFNIDTGSAGPNLITVGIITSKGFCELVAVKHLGNGRFDVNYTINEKVRGLIYVRYGDCEITGSPFPIDSN